MNDLGISQRDNCPSYTKIFKDLASVYILNDVVVKNRGGEYAFDNVITENKKIINIYCKQDKVGIYTTEIEQLKKRNSKIEEKIFIHVRN